METKPFLHQLISIRVLLALGQLENSYIDVDSQLLLEEQIERLHQLLARKNIKVACQEVFEKAENLSKSLLEGVF